MFPLLGSLISGGASLLGGLFNSSSQQAINAQNIANQDYQNTHSIQERVADARAAGINPLAALGAPGLTSATAVGNDSMGNAMSAAGQDLGRSVAAQSTAADRMYQEQKRSLDIENSSLQNQLLASRIRTMNQPGNPPPMPSDSLIPGQAPTALVKAVPQKLEPQSDANPNIAPGVNPEVELVRTGSGYMPMPSKAFQGASFGSDISSALWDTRNIVGPTLGFNRARLPERSGYYWKFTPWGGYSEVPIPGSPDSLQPGGRW